MGRRESRKVVFLVDRDEVWTVGVRIDQKFVMSWTKNLFSTERTFSFKSILQTRKNHTRNLFSIKHYSIFIELNLLKTSFKYINL